MKDKQLEFECPHCKNDTLRYDAVKANPRRVIMESDGSLSAEDFLPFDYEDISDDHAGDEQYDFYCDYCKVTYFYGTIDDLAEQLAMEMKERASGVMSKHAELTITDKENDNKELS